VGCWAGAVEQNRGPQLPSLRLIQRSARCTCTDSHRRFFGWADFAFPSARRWLTVYACLRARLTATKENVLPAPIRTSALLSSPRVACPHYQEPSSALFGLISHRSCGNSDRKITNEGRGLMARGNRKAVTLVISSCQLLRGTRQDVHASAALTYRDCQNIPTLHSRII